MTEDWKTRVFGRLHSNKMYALVAEHDTGERIIYSASAHPLGGHGMARFGISTWEGATRYADAEASIDGHVCDKQCADWAHHVEPVEHAPKG